MTVSGISPNGTSLVSVSNGADQKVLVPWGFFNTCAVWPSADSYSLANELFANELFWRVLVCAGAGLREVLCGDLGNL